MIHRLIQKQSQDESMDRYSSSCSDEGGSTHSARLHERRREPVRGNRRGRGLVRGRGRGGPGEGHSKRKTHLPKRAVSIKVNDSRFEEEDDYCPLREVGPQIPGGSSALSELDLLSQYFNDEMIGRLVVATNDYAEQKTRKGDAYRRFKSSPLTKEEMWR